MTIGQRFKELRGNLTLKVFAEPLGVSPSAISNIENDRAEPSVELALKISQVYKVSLDWLLKGEGRRDGLSGKTVEPDENFVKISKDELIALQRQALKNKEEELVQQQEQIGKLQKQVQATKNIEGAVH